MAQKIIQPLGNKLLILPIEKKEQKSHNSDIIIPETANNDLEEGLVVESAKELNHLINNGDTVIYSSTSGVGQYYKGKVHRWLNVNEVWGLTTTESE